MSHDELTELLRSLPRASASRDFTARAVARITARPRNVASLRSAFAVVATFIVLLAGTMGIRRHQEQVRIEHLRVEKQQIERELQELKALSNASEPQVLVGTSGQYDFVVGMKSRNDQPKSRPVSLHVANDGIS